MATTNSRSPGCAQTELSNLKHHRTSDANRAHQWWTWRLFGLLFLLMLSNGAQAKPTLIWLLRDLPPLTIFEGPKKGQGAVDQLLPILIEHLPDYRHQILHVNRARGMQMPVIFVSGHADVPIVVRAFRAGAVDFIEKPFGERDMLRLVEQCLLLERDTRDKRRLEADTADRITPDLDRRIVAAVDRKRGSR